MKSRIRFYLKNKNQSQLLLVVREYYNKNNEVEFAKILFEI